MRKKSIFSLDPDQLERLFSVGTGESDPIEEQEPQKEINKPGLDREDTAQEKAHPSHKRDLSANTTASLVGMERPGSQIGRYKLLHVLGEGGMGIVYLAEQKHPIRRQVALKVIKPGMDSKRIIARFEAERQALAILDHPNIAHVHDAGTTESGRPYFVMEYVKGLSITEHCDRHKLTIEERLRLFQQVCLAIQHAHQKGIIHRDIKPSNIIVSTQDDKATPKIIDFGVAKALAQPLTERTLATEDSQLLGTPEYMSPEQADMASVEIDTRSDIYSLGVLLYVLLTGALPFDSDTLRTGGIERIRQIIRETDPKTPSTRLTNLGEEAIKVAQSRQLDIATLAKKLHKELEWIPLKAMRKERSERYRSASELADDVENYLNSAPLIAGPLSTIYRLKKFAHRNRALVTGIAAVLIVLVSGVIGIAVFAIKAEQRRAEAQMITNFLKNDVLSSARNILGREATVHDILDATRKKLEGAFVDEPMVEASICETLRQTYSDIGYYAAAAQQAKRRYDICLEELGENNRATKIAMNWLAVSYYHAGMYREAEPLYVRLIEEAKGDKSPVPDSLLSWFKANLSTTYEGLGRHEEAEQLLRTTLETAKWNPDSEGWAQYGHHLGDIYMEMGRYGEAEAAYRKSLEAKSTLHPPAGSIVRALSGLGRLHMAQGHHDEPEHFFKQGIEIGNRGLPGKGHPRTLRSVNGLGVLRTKQKRYGEAEDLFHEALEGRKLKLGENHPETLETKNDLAVLYKEQGAYDKAEPLLLEALKGRRLKLGETHPHTKESLNNLIDLYEAWGEPEQAKKWKAILAESQSRL